MSGEISPTLFLALLFGAVTVLLAQRLGRRRAEGDDSASRANREESVQIARRRALSVVHSAWMHSLRPLMTPYFECSRI